MFPDFTISVKVIRIYSEVRFTFKVVKVANNLILTFLSDVEQVLLNSLQLGECKLKVIP